MAEMISTVRHALTRGPAAPWRAGRGLAGFLWPERCAGCGSPDPEAGLLCRTCFALVPRLAQPLCARCLVHEADPLCGRHPRHRVWPAWDYDDRAALVIEALKYGARTDLAAPLGAELARSVPAQPFDLVVAVPLHPARRRERGYNQSELLAASLADAIGVPHLPAALERVRATAAQARLGSRARRANVRGAFRVRHPERFGRRRLLVVDDVITTGATLEACLDAVSAVDAVGTGVALAWAQ
jgi:ComF family protein